MGGGGIHGGGGQNVNTQNEWEKSNFGVGANLHKQVQKADTKGRTDKTRDKDALETATQEGTQATTTVNGKPPARNGSRPITLRSNNPVLDQPNATGAAPPKGPGGTGNPFFNINPMSIFFEEFLQMMNMQKQTQLITNKLAVQDAKMILGMAQDQATAIVNEADVQAAALTKQAIMQFVEAGANAVMAGASAVGGGLAKEEVNAERKAQAKVTKDAENSLHEAEHGAEEMKPLNAARGKVAAKDEMLNEVNNELKQTRSAVNKSSKEAGQGEALGEEELSMKEGGSEELESVEDNEKKMKDLEKKKLAKQKELDINKGALDKNKVESRENDKAIEKQEKDIEDSKLVDETDTTKGNTKAKQKELEQMKAKKDELSHEKERLENKRDDLIEGQQKNDLEYQKLDAKNKYLKNNKELEGQIQSVNKKLAENDETIEKNKKDLSSEEAETENQKLEAENQELQGKRSKLLTEKKDKLEASRTDDEAEVGEASSKLDQNKDVQKARAKHQEELKKLQELDSGAYKRAVENLQGKPWFSALQAGTQALNTALQAGSKLVDAQSKVQAAGWEAMKAKIAGEQQLMSAAMQAMTSARQDSFGQANDIAQTLIKMSDQEQQSMHWA
jgi:hypothetical protein